MVNFVDISLDSDEKAAVLGILDSGMLAQGKKVAEFESVVSQACKAKFGVAVNSGTAALHTALYSAGIKPGDEVITTPFTFVATANSIIMQGAKPIFVDIDEKTFNIDPEKIMEKITEKTKAIITVDLFGQACNYEKIREITAGKNIKIIEDACQAIGAKRNGMPAGSLGDIGTFSFYATKNLFTGEGGMLVTNNEEYCELAKRFRHHGQSEKTRYEYYDLGYNYRMTDVLAAIGVEQVKKLEALSSKRMENAAKLNEGLKNIEGIEIPFVDEGNEHVYHQYTIKVSSEKRSELMEFLKSKGIGCGIYYPKPLHMHPFFLKMGYKEGDFPVSEKMSKQVISLPIHQNLTDDEINEIISAIGEFYA